ncbi:T-cell receptor alpha chain V region CTL-L17 [Myotis davidii]|nr:T-cell receptor alpha chain V region CTL-L17 [Myotis davidii]
MMKTSIGALFMFLWLQLDRVSHGEKVDQHPSTLNVQEGNTAVINCSYSDSASNYFPWYKQELGKGPQLSIHILSNKDKIQAGRLTVFMNKAAKHLSLHIAATQPGDSAVYFCAASTHCFPGTCILYTNLRVGQPPLPGTDLQAQHL